VGIGGAGAGPDAGPEGPAPGVSPVDIHRTPSSTLILFLPRADPPVDVADARWWSMRVSVDRTRGASSVRDETGTGAADRAAATNLSASLRADMV
jgi:hypothetical protein